MICIEDEVHRYLSWKDYTLSQYTYSDIFSFLLALPSSTLKYFSFFINKDICFCQINSFLYKNSTRMTLIYYNFIQKTKTQSNFQTKSFQLNCNYNYTNDIIHFISKKARILPSYTPNLDFASHDIYANSEFIFLNNCKIPFVLSRLLNTLWFKAIIFASLFTLAPIPLLNCNLEKNMAYATLIFTLLSPLGYKAIISKQNIFNKLNECCNGWYCF